MDKTSLAPAIAPVTVKQTQMLSSRAKRSHSSAGSARNGTPAKVDLMLEREAERIILKLVEKALDGDMVALRLCVERLLPPKRDRPVAFDLPAMQNAADALNASSAILTACAAGTLSPGEAAEIMSLVSTHVRMLEMTEIEARLIALEKAHKP